MYLYIKALHIVFVVTWFAGMFYLPRLFIYNVEAQNRPEVLREGLHEQFSIMIRRLLFGITWPSAVITLILGLTMWKLLGTTPGWLIVKLVFVAGLYFYHISLHVIAMQQVKRVFKYSSQQLRIWNEVATIFLVAIVMLVVVKEKMSVVWGLAGLVLFVILLMSAIRIYKMIRTRKTSK